MKLAVKNKSLILATSKFKLQGGNSARKDVAGFFYAFNLNTAALHTRSIVVIALEGPVTDLDSGLSGSAACLLLPNLKFKVMSNKVTEFSEQEKNALLKAFGGLAEFHGKESTPKQIKNSIFFTVYNLLELYCGHEANEPTLEVGNAIFDISQLYTFLDDYEDYLTESKSN